MSIFLYALFVVWVDAAFKYQISSRQRSNWTDDVKSWIWLSLPQLKNMRHGTTKSCLLTFKL